MHRFSLDHFDNYYFSQRQDGNRVPKEPYAHLYDVHIEVFKPRDEMTRLIHYENNSSIEYHKKKIGQSEKEIESTSESEQEDDTRIEQQGWAWDLMYLTAYQLDEEFNKKQPRKVTCVSTVDLENHAHIIVDPEVTKWPCGDNTYHYLAKHLVIQLEGEKVKQIGIDVPQDGSIF